MNYPKTLARLRKESGLTQVQVADFISRHSDKPYTFRTISHWETGQYLPTMEHFLLLCELYGVKDIQGTFRGVQPEYRNIRKLNALGKSRVEEYITFLSNNSLFSEADGDAGKFELSRLIRLYDVPVAAGTGSYLDSDSYENIEVDDTVPSEADFAVKVSGDSMTPRFVDGQIIFIKEQSTLEVGETGIFELNGDSYVKKLGKRELISLNPEYEPIRIHEYDSFHIFGKVVG